MKDRLLSLMAWTQNAVIHGEEGESRWNWGGGGLLVTILVVLLILCAAAWLYFNVGVHQK